MSTPEELLANLDREIAKEEQRIEDGVSECRRTGRSMHDNYWHHLYKLREKRRALLAVVGALRG